jgi:hypothetical protein
MQLKIKTARDQISWYPVYCSHSAEHRTPNLPMVSRRIMFSLSTQRRARRMHYRSAPHYFLHPSHLTLDRERQHDALDKFSVSAVPRYAIGIRDTTVFGRALF